MVVESQIVPQLLSLLCFETAFMSNLLTVGRATPDLGMPFVPGI